MRLNFSSEQIIPKKCQKQTTIVDADENEGESSALSSLITTTQEICNWTPKKIELSKQM